MLFPAPLLEIHLLGRADRKHAVIQSLQAHGALHLSEARLDHPQLARDYSLPGVDAVSDALLKLRYLAEQTGIHPQPNGPHREINEALERAGAFIERYLGQVRLLAEKRDASRKQLERLNARRAALAQIPFPLVAERTKTLTTELYRAPHALSVEVPRARTAHHQHKKTHYLKVVVPKSKLPLLEKALEGQGAKRVDIDYLAGSSEDYLNTLLERIAEAEERLTRTRHELTTVLSHRASNLGHLIGVLENHYHALTAGNRLQRSAAFFVLRGYIARRDLEALERDLPDVEIHARPAGADAPSKLEHGRLAKPFRQITEMFSTPRYGAVDPTRLLALFYPLFFGFMLSDIGYGALLVLGALALRLSGKDALIKASPIVAWSALSTVAFGLAFGSFFGGLIPVRPLVTDAFQGAMGVLIAALILGLVHLTLGAALRIVQSARDQKSPWEILKEAGPLFLLEGAGAAFWLGEPVIAGVLVALAAALLVARGGLLGVMDLSGYFGTWFSYARLLALALATAGVALAVNTIADKAHAVSVVGPALWLFIIVFGHAFNFVVNLIGSAINAARLNYVEFFGLFFEGGGVPFEPLRLTTQGGN